MSTQLRVLVVDDDRLSRVTTTKQLKAEHYDAKGIETPFAAIQEIETGHWDVVLSDVRMPGMTGIDLLQEIKKIAPDVDVILMTAYGTVEIAVEAMRLGAADFLIKPFKVEELVMRLRKIAEWSRAHSELERLRKLVGEESDDMDLVGACPQVIAIRGRIHQFADHSAPVLITGETGTGKEVVARALHRMSHRSGASFIAVPCGAIPNELAESELFGHEKGSYTGAQSSHKGSFERAHAGTLLLDDIDDLPLEIQVKLLRVLQEGTLVRLGGSREIQVDVRIVATTKVQLETEVAKGNFRSDLFYRLRGLEIALPPLRERGDDLLLLTHHFLRTLAEDGQEAKHLSLEGAQLLQGYDWPGNVRELHRMLEAAIILGTGPELLPEHLPRFLTESPSQSRPFVLNLENRSRVPFAETVHEFELSLMQWAMRKAGGRQAVAARLLGIPRTTLQSKLASHKVEATKSSEA